jgi:hypothetical protein
MRAGRHKIDVVFGQKAPVTEGLHGLRFPYSPNMASMQITILEVRST